MKRGNVLDIFEDKKLQIDEKFKNNLRRELMKRETANFKNSKKAKNSIFNVKLAVFGSALALVLVVASLFGSFNRGLLISEVLAQASSADEVINKTDSTFVKSQNSHRVGGVNFCGQPITADVISYSEREYFYNDGNRSAYYGNRSYSDGTNTQYMNYEENSKNRVKISQFKQDGAGDSPLEVLDRGGYKIVNQQGNVIEDQKASVIRFEGREVYQILFLEENTSNFAEVYQGTCQTPRPAITELLIDVQSLDLVTHRVYAGEVAEGNLVEENINDTSYLAISFEEALSNMTQDGFDLQEAKLNSKN